MSAENDTNVAKVDEPTPVSVEESNPTTSAAVEPTTPAIPIVKEPVEEPVAKSATEPETTKDAAVDEHKTPSRSPSVSFDKDAKTQDGSPKTPLAKLFLELPEILKTAEYTEMWGITLDTSDDSVPTSIVLEKFLRANNKDVAKAKAQLIEALKWRKTMQPRKLLEDFEFDQVKFGDLGYVTTYTTGSGKKEIFTWNIYGAAKNLKNTFGDVAEFIKWRAALMELSVKELDLASATEKIPQDGVDPYRMTQVHDYLNVSFLRMDSSVKAASKETIQVFGMAYPELLEQKFFVNVPLVMSWVFTAMKIFLSPETVKKFHPLGYGSNLAAELPEVAEKLPKEYGGKGEDLKTGLTVKYAKVEAAATTA